MHNYILSIIIMVSAKSIKNFIIVNSFLHTLGFLFYPIMLKKHYGFIYLFLLARNYLFLGTFDSMNIEGRLISDKQSNKPPIEKYKYEFDKCVAVATGIEVFGLSIAPIAKSNYPMSTIINLLTFIPKTFVFELIFDFFHYWAHRICHHPWLYYLHKKHHTHVHPRAITAFYQGSMDLLLTNVIPFYLASKIWPLTDIQLAVFVMYKSFIEIAGHLGRKSYPTSSFPQFVWLPRWLGIELYCEDHDAHHTQFKYNFSKRFVIWDKVFGTYKHQKLIRDNSEHLLENEKTTQTHYYDRLVTNRNFLISVGLFTVTYLKMFSIF